MTTTKGRKSASIRIVQDCSRALLIEEWTDALSMWAGNDEQVQQDMEGIEMPAPRGSMQCERIRLYDVGHDDLAEVRAIIELQMTALETAYDAIQTLPGWAR